MDPDYFRVVHFSPTAVIYPADFVSFLCKRARSADEQVVMARIALNALYDPEMYPVDVHELMLLRNESRVMTEAFLAFCAINPDQYASWSAQLCEELFAICADGRRELSEETFAAQVNGERPAPMNPAEEVAHARL